MPYTDLPVHQLREHTSEVTAPADLYDFWTQTLAQVREHDLAATFTPVETGLAVIDTFDVSFAGFGGQPVRGWLRMPTVRSGPLPTVVEYVGYGGGRGLAHERLIWAAAGYAHLVMDTRGQGSSWSVGDTPDTEAAGLAGAPAHPGYLTRGVLDPLTYYYRRVFTDAVRAVEAVRTHEAVDPARVAVTGGSQGGGISLAVAGLVDDLVGVAPDVPFLCDMPRAVTISGADPYGEVARFLRAHRHRVDDVLRTLAYFDGCVLGARASAPALFSVALMDEVCPPSMVYAAYNSYGGARAIREYAFNGHEGGEGFHEIVKLRWLADLVAGTGGQ